MCFSMVNWKVHQIIVNGTVQWPEVDVREVQLKLNSSVNGLNEPGQPS